MRSKSEVINYTFLQEIQTKNKYQQNVDYISSKSNDNTMNNISTNENVN